VLSRSEGLGRERISDELYSPQSSKQTCARQAHDKSSLFAAC
jgi:hypothetical protein